MRWLDVMPHLASRLHLRRVRIMTTRRGGMVSLLALVGMLVLLAGCGSGTTLPQLHLAWQQMTMPPQTSITSFTIGVAPSDGDVAYACSVDPTASQRQLHLWVTRDRSAHWTHLADLTVPSGSDQCSIVVDELQPATAIASVNWSPADTGPQIATSASYATLDGGTTWRQLSGQSPFEVHQLATRSGITYAILNMDAPSGEQDELATSVDNLRTWQPNVQSQSFGLGRVPYAFWLDPASDAVLIAGKNGVWRSDDAGNTWTNISPSLDPSTLLQEVVVQAPQAGQPWSRNLCAETDQINPPAPPNALICSFDGGKTWSSQPALNERVNGSGKSYAYPPADVFALDGNSAVLAGIGFLPQGETFYRLAPQGQQWQVIGNLKGATSTSFEQPTSLNPTPSGDVIWSYSIDQGWFFAPYPPAQP